MCITCLDGTSSLSAKLAYVYLECLLAYPGRRGGGAAAVPRPAVGLHDVVEARDGLG